MRGREQALKKGVKFGRPPKLDSVQRKQALSRRESGERISVIARDFDVSGSTISRL